MRTFSQKQEEAASNEDKQEAANIQRVWVQGGIVEHVFVGFAVAYVDYALEGQVHN